jgi:hypothetical protein
MRKRAHPSVAPMTGNRPGLIFPWQFHPNQIPCSATGGHGYSLFFWAPVVFSKGKASWHFFYFFRSYRETFDTYALTSVVNDLQLRRLLRMLNGTQAESSRR